MGSTYKNFGASNSLAQGDLIARTPDIEAMIAEHFPSVICNHNIYFQVLSQSCDLVRDGNRLVKISHINLCPVVTLKYLVRDRSKKFRIDGCDTKLDATYFSDENAKLIVKEKFREEIKNFLCSALNNQNDDFFFIPEDSGLRIQSPMMSILGSCFSVNAKQYYDHIHSAKIAEFSDDLKARLGWMIGSRFARVATNDIPHEEREKIISGCINDNFFPVPENKRVAFTGSDFHSKQFNEWPAILGGIKVESNVERLANSILSKVRALCPGSDLDLLKQRIIADGSIGNLIKQ